MRLTDRLKRWWKPGQWQEDHPLSEEERADKPSSRPRTSTSTRSTESARRATTASTSTRTSGSRNSRRERQQRVVSRPGSRRSSTPEPRSRRRRDRRAVPTRRASTRRRPLQNRDLRMLGTKPLTSVLKKSERDLPSLEYRNAHTFLPVGGCDRHLNGMLDAVARAGRLDEADGARDRRGRVVLEAVGEREVEEHLGVGRPSISG